MDIESQHLPWETPETPKLAEAPGSRQEVIPFVSPERAARLFSSLRSMPWEAKKRQIDLSLGRLKDSD